MNLVGGSAISILVMALLAFRFYLSRLSWDESTDPADQQHTVINITDLASSTPSIYSATCTNPNRLLIFGVAIKKGHTKNNMSVLAVEANHNNIVTKLQPQPKLWTITGKAKANKPFRHFVRKKILYEIHLTHFQVRHAANGDATAQTNGFSFWKIPLHQFNCKDGPSFKQIEIGPDNGMMDCSDSGIGFSNLMEGKKSKSIKWQNIPLISHANLTTPTISDSKANLLFSLTKSFQTFWGSINVGFPIPWTSKVQLPSAEHEHTRSSELMPEAALSSNSSMERPDPEGNFESLQRSSQPSSLVSIAMQKSRDFLKYMKTWLPWSTPGNEFNLAQWTPWSKTNPTHRDHSDLNYSTACNDLPFSKNSPLVSTAPQVLQCILLYPHFNSHSVKMMQNLFRLLKKQSQSYKISLPWWSQYLQS